MGGFLKIFLTSFPLLIFLFLELKANDNGYDTYRWVGAASVTDAQRLKRPDGIYFCNQENHLVSLARVDLGGHYVVGNYNPSCSKSIYFSWWNGGIPAERYVQDLVKWKVELLVHDLDSLSWVHFRGKLPSVAGHVHVGKYERDNTWVGVCRGFSYENVGSGGQRKLFVGKYLWTLNGDYTSNGCVMSCLGKEVITYDYEILIVNLIGRSSRDPSRGHRTYPGISPEYLPGWG